MQKSPLASIGQRILSSLHVYHPGDRVPSSGLYDVKHDRGHREPHQVTVIEGRKFPPCRGCGRGVTFQLNVRADHLHDHPDFDSRGY